MKLEVEGEKKNLKSSSITTEWHIEISDRKKEITITKH